jgi:hypothetical protein
MPIVSPTLRGGNSESSSSGVNARFAVSIFHLRSSCMYVFVGVCVRIGMPNAEFWPAAVINAYTDSKAQDVKERTENALYHEYAF